MNRARSGPRCRDADTALETGPDHAVPVPGVERTDRR